MKGKKTNEEGQIVYLRMNHDSFVRFFFIFDQGRRREKKTEDITNEENHYHTSLLHQQDHGRCREIP